METATSEKKELEIKARQKQRYRYIKYLAEMRDLSIGDLHQHFTKASEIRGHKPCHFTVFYRVCQGKRTSKRIMRWVSQQLKVPFKELWA